MVINAFQSLVFASNCRAVALAPAVRGRSASDACVPIGLDCNRGASLWPADAGVCGRIWILLPMTTGPDFIDSIVFADGRAALLRNVRPGAAALAAIPAVCSR